MFRGLSRMKERERHTDDKFFLPPCKKTRGFYREPETPVPLGCILKRYRYRSSCHRIFEITIRAVTRNPNVCLQKMLGFQTFLGKQHSTSFLEVGGRRYEHIFLESEADLRDLLTTASLSPRNELFSFLKSSSFPWAQN